MVLRGTAATVSNNILGISHDQWATPISSWSISQVNQIPSLIIYYHQYQVTASYSTSDGSIPSSNIILSGTQYGSNYQLPLTTTNQVIWLDANTPWSTSTIATAPSGTEQWVATGVTSGSVSGATTVDPVYYDQYQVTASYSTSDNTSPSAAVVLSRTSLGSSSSTTLTTTPALVWLDAGSSWSVNTLITAGSGTEQWVATGVTSGSVSGATTVDPVYYDQYQVTASYSTSDSSTPSASVVLSGASLGSSSSTTLTTTPALVWLDAGLGWSVNNPITSGTQRWDAAFGTSGTVTGAVAIAPSYYHQFLQTLSYSVVGGGSPSAPTATGTELGVAYVPSLTTSATGYWFDASGSITFSTSTGGIDERWAPSPASISTTSANTQIVSMYNQYQVTANYSTSDDSTPSPSVVLSGTQFGSTSYTLTLTTSSQTPWLDAGTGWSVNNPINAVSGTEHWDAASGTSGTVSSAVTIAPMYYHQYQITFVVNGDGSTSPTGSNVWENARLSFHNGYSWRWLFVLLLVVQHWINNL